jgi:[CysO sulfur-carrier protein]-S-L-cysteine hydrolase
MLWLKPEQARAILEHVRRAAPDEACGLLLGQGVEILEVIPAGNEDPSPRTGYIVAPRDLYAGLARAEHEGLELIAAYHSHPAGRPIPSERDIKEWHYPEAAQVIVGLGGPEPEIAAWRVSGGRVARLDLFILAERPLPTASEPQRSTPAQRLAMIAAGIIAVAIVLIAAFSLLPPPAGP